MNKIEGTIFFDLDGTLIDTSERHYKVYFDILKSNNKPVLPKEIFWDYKRLGKKTEDLFEDDVPIEFKKYFEREWLKKIEQKEYLKYDYLFPGTLKLLNKLQNKLELVLVTLRNNPANLYWELDYFNLSHFFKEIITLDPSLENKAKMIGNYKGKSEIKNFMIIGDTEADIIAGKELDIITVAITSGIRTKEFLESLNPDFCINHLNDISNILLKMK